MKPLAVVLKPEAVVVKPKLVFGKHKLVFGKPRAVVGKPKAVVWKRGGLIVEMIEAVVLVCGVGWKDSYRSFLLIEKNQKIKAWNSHRPATTSQPERTKPLRYAPLPRPVLAVTSYCG
ncbi:MAG: hypothetical protein GC178_04690 [Flavobacteriales bacterium]|nr:hypothetical protein [Flavobacteriales bacterium]